MLIEVDYEVRWGEVRWLVLGDNVVDNSVGWWLMLVVVNNQVPLDIFWGQNKIYVSAAGADLCLSSHSHWSRGLTPSFCWPTQAGAAAWSSLYLAPPRSTGYGNVRININISEHRVALVRSHITSQYTQSAPYTTIFIIFSLLNSNKRMGEASLSISYEMFHDPLELICDSENIWLFLIIARIFVYLE